MTERQKSDRREKMLAKQEDGKRVSGSGSTPFAKEDISFKGILYQDKRSAQASLSVKMTDLYRLQFHASNAGKVPCFGFAFDGTDEDWCAFPRWWLKNQSWWQALKEAKE